MIASLAPDAETSYTATVSLEHRKRLGQFFTPPRIADFMAQWVMGNPCCQTILDPAVGPGIFFRSILQCQNAAHCQLIGYDIDEGVLAHAATLFQDVGQTQLCQQDYLFTDWDRQYDGIICNPPYLKFQDYKKRAASLEEFQTRLQMTLSGFTNIYSLFLLKALKQLAPGGRAAFIVPSEFLNSDYGTRVKQHLLESQMLRYVVVFDPTDTVFEDALTTSCILLLANDEHASTVTFVTDTTTHDLTGLATALTAYPHAKVSGKIVARQDLEPHIKWRAYYQKQRQSYRNLVPLATYGKVVRGIATGDNDYFSFNEAKQKQFKIDDKFLLPCLTKASHAQSNFFTAAQFANLRQQGKNVFLFNATGATDPAVAKYIGRGEALKADEKYLTSHRTPWFALEKRPPAPILITVFNRNGLRFVRNEAAVTSLTCFHSLYLHLLAQPRLDLLMAYLLTEVSREILNDNRREYGGGLHKFEPNDLNRAQVIDLDSIDAASEEAITAAYYDYRQASINGAPTTIAGERLNQMFSDFLRG